MKKILYILVPVMLLAAVSCQEEKLSPDSVIRVSQAEQNDFDKWLEAEYRNPYNIEFKYRYEMNETDVNYFTIPADYECSIKMAHLLKYLCIDAFDEVVGPVFTKTYFPKMFFLIGSWQYNNNGTIVLGSAEGGKKITLAGINQLKDKINDMEYLNKMYFKTIHHEFTHIMNQTRVYSTDFKMVTPDRYVSDSWNSEPYDKTFLSRGFISDYAQMSDVEDFAEMTSMFVTHDEAWWQQQLTLAGEGAQYISAKLELVKLYYAETYKFDLEELRATILRRSTEISAGLVDLDDITIK